jgi:carbamate kinase
MSNNRPTVIALGGNAISVPGEQGNIPQQFAHMSNTARYLVGAVADGRNIVITHGNGPQVGNVLRRVELASSEMYPLPLEVCVADTQAGMGYMIGQCMVNALKKRGIETDVTTLVTNVLVDKSDLAFKRPTKPIGSQMPRKQAEGHRDKDGWSIVEVADGIYRRIVPSPIPQEIIELNTIRRLVEDGELVICCGGGGVPVTRDEHGMLRGAAAVIDKDRTSALLARELNAQTLVILTAVEQVCLNFGTPDQKALDTLTISEAKTYLKEGHFAEGSMGPKIEAAVDFVEGSNNPDAVAIIAELPQLTAALDGKSGTRILRG